ncbi:ProQ/FINO family protein [Thiothrix eikelboomii]|uniref:ProQ/FINO family protein n=1 Tax=Thiothrix eikelboomii TaxID=92487 RepID=A0A1T4XFW2_9GAMM|nr:ProQ/FINO family protein [Thiothrix eikelboomii]SKA88389.1 ProQ/FINO family protein [Thiothrix eikelboomii]
MNDQPRKTLSIKPKIEQASILNQETKTVLRGNKRIIKREQVQANALAKLKAKVPAKKTSKPRKTAPKKPLVAPSAIRMDNLNAALNAFVVWREHQPLALGIERQIFQLIAQQNLSASKRVVQKLLYQHTHQRHYLLKVGQGGARFNLDGSAGGVVLPEESKHTSFVLAKQLK